MQPLVLPAPHCLILSLESGLRSPRLSAPSDQGYHPRFTAEYIERTVGPEAFCVGENFVDLRWCAAVVFWGLDNRDGWWVAAESSCLAIAACAFRLGIMRTAACQPGRLTPSSPPASLMSRQGSYLERNQDDARNRFKSWLREARHCRLFDFITK